MLFLIVGIENIFGTLKTHWEVKGNLMGMFWELDENILRTPKFKTFKNT